jgi:type II secretory pathway pseudopilin PulG
MRRTPTSRRKAFVFIDIAIALALIGLITFGLVAAVGRHQRAAQKLSDTRAAARAADDALTALRAGARVPPPPGATVAMSRLPDAAPEGQAWVRAEARIGAASAAVVGLVPLAREIPAAAGEAGAP